MKRDSGNLQARNCLFALNTIVFATKAPLALLTLIETVETNHELQITSPSCLSLRNQSGNQMAYFRAPRQTIFKTLSSWAHLVRTYLLVEGHTVPNT